MTDIRRNKKMSFLLRSIQITLPIRTVLLSKCFASHTTKPTSLKNVLKKFYLKVHPDRFALYPDISKVNGDSFQILQSFLEHISSTSDEKKHPPAKVQPLSFYMWTTHEAVSAAAKLNKSHTHKKSISKNTKFPPATTANDMSKNTHHSAPVLQKISIILRTSGGNCKHLVQESLTGLFVKSGVTIPWQWDDTYWKEPIMLTQAALETEEREEAEERAAAEGMSDEAFGEFLRRRAEAKERSAAAAHVP